MNAIKGEASKHFTPIRLFTTLASNIHFYNLQLKKENLPSYALSFALSQQSAMNIPSKSSAPQSRIFPWHTEIRGSRLPQLPPWRTAESPRQVVL